MIRENLSALRDRIWRVCGRTARKPEEITFVAVSKNRSADQIKEVIASGIADIGENRVQEAVLKYNSLAFSRLRWHMIGHLQSNKAKEAVGIFDLIHSLDSLGLAIEIDKQAGKINKIQDVLVEVNVSKESSKFGLKPEETSAFIENIRNLKNIRVKGLMTIAPLSGDPENARPFFSALRELKNKINIAAAQPLTVLSMGMTDDFEVAIEEGSTMVRIGRAVFE